MPVERHFLGWDAPVTAKVREFLLPSQFSAPIDLGKELIIVPTLQAGRRLRETLALYCAEQNTALLSPLVVTPTFLLRADNESANIASQIEMAAVWSNILMNLDISNYKGLFPSQTPKRDFTWAIHTGEMIQQLRETLLEGGYLITDVYQKFGEIIEESERWQNLSDLETAYLTRIGELGRYDPYALMINRSQKPELPEGIERIIIAAVPDPALHIVQTLEKLAEQVPIDVLIHAPESLADHFDKWGRPIPEKWNERMIEIPAAEKNIFLSSSHITQSHKAIEIIAEETDRFGPSDIAIGVPDNSITSFISSDLAENGLPTFDPSGKALKEHPLYQLLDAFRTIVNERTFKASSAFIRHADVLNFLQIAYKLQPRWLLEELDTFQNQHLPVTIKDLTTRFPYECSEDRKRQCKFANLEKASLFIQKQLELFEHNDLDSALRSILQTLYKVRMVNPNNPDDEEFIAAAKQVDVALRELASEAVTALNTDKRLALELLLRRLSKQRYYLERRSGIIDFEGWLELSWNDAPFLIITGMNDGFVPDSHLSDIFLPDSLRRKLNLRHDADRLARDAYMTQSIIESRRKDGRVCFMVSKTGTASEPLKPSRLLFRCSDAELPQRAKQLFGDPGDTQDNYPPTISFLLEACPPADVLASKLKQERMSVTRFKDYLNCPFRYYLKHILGMEEMDDEKNEMDALDFGSLVHHAFQKMSASTEMSLCRDHHELSHFLHTEAENWVKKRFGNSPPLQIEIQLDAARQRLNAAARVQAKLIRDGWEILYSEMRIDTELEGMHIRGQIDRIDRHRDTGCIRILDYKTSDNAKSPEDTHIGSAQRDTADYARLNIDGKEKRWIDLQLPLYKMLLPDKEEFQGQVELGYFNLPKAVSDTDVAIWEDFSNDLMESARNCTSSIIKFVQNCIFWPPASRVQFDEFESLFHTNIPDCINLSTFESFMEVQTNDSK